MDLISIVTPMYNGEKYVKQTIESVIAQTYNNWELIIVDDGSKDNGANIVESYTLVEPRIRLIKQSNAGSSAARNNGLRNANGQYICFLDADDYWEKDFLKEQLLFLLSHNAVVVFSSYRRVNEVGSEILKPYIVPKKVNYKGLLKTCSISCLTAMFDRNKTGNVLFNEKMGSMRDDYVFWLSILKKGGYAYGNPHVLASYRVLTTSTTGNKRKVVKPHFLVYYKIEKLGLLKSLYYLTNWAVISYFKYK